MCRQEPASVYRYGFTSHSVVQINGLPTTARAPTIVDLARTEPPQICASTDRPIGAGWLDHDVELQRAAAIGAGRTGNSQLLRVVARCTSGAQAESERILHRLLDAAGLRGWVAQYRVRLPTGLAYIDVAFAESRLAIEVDGRQFHGSHSDRFENDRSRQNALMQADGWCCGSPGRCSLTSRSTWLQRPAGRPTATRSRFRPSTAAQPTRCPVQFEARRVRRDRRQPWSTAPESTPGTASRCLRSRLRPGRAAR